MRWLIVGIITTLLLTLVSLPAQASTGLKIQPLEYTAQLDSGAKQRGVVDISNPFDEPIQVETSVQAVRQINDQGELEFYDDEAVTAGIRLDQASLILPAKGAFRLVFELDGSKLPTGDSVAAIFAETVSEKGSVGGSARVGTLLFITNGTPTGRQAALTSLDVSWLQPGGEVSGRYQVANTADQSLSTGFRPEVTMQLTPLHGATTTTGPLVFAGRERIVDFTLPTSAFGVYQLTISTGDSQQSRWLLLLPAWSFLVFIGLFCLGFGWRYFGRRKPRRRSVSRPPQSNRK